MVGNGRSYREIMDTLGIPERTFYRYLSQAFEHDRQLLQEQDKNNLAFENDTGVPYVQGIGPPWGQSLINGVYGAPSFPLKCECLSSLAKSHYQLFH
jgi:hypothetical protein